MCKIPRLLAFVCVFIFLCSRPFNISIDRSVLNELLFPCLTPEHNLSLLQFGRAFFALRNKVVLLLPSGSKGPPLLLLGTLLRRSDFFTRVLGSRPWLFDSWILGSHP